MSENIPQFGVRVSPENNPYQPSAPYSPVGSNYQAPVAPPKKPGLGIAALILSIVVFVGSLVWSIANGIASWEIEIPTGSSFEEIMQESMTSEMSMQDTLFGLSTMAHLGVGTLLGVGALVMGIIAISTKRGRVQGIVATIIAALAPLVSYLVYSVVAALGMV
ncbi:hypothetical protein M2152_000611 [Microbacteriaceae bacterium SG_E_30_P1]|uniref:Yip1 domain-containing protein n=1 Tax=Antiquaquibacter oligotrophicus TaxID=2880260 RepID=A0ABT6KMN2_9MICO|nr:hypothetical protein [Antiquaquibacter oligotrophicus]MDH6180429.1 hypothetical protein [Antiquaquibacter oligotrophicus]UDF13833.1 hypothetical protein LH407_02970 [Antiquaquibacter oligotrophicus]